MLVHFLRESPDQVPGHDECLDDEKPFRRRKRRKRKKRQDQTLPSELEDKVIDIIVDKLRVTKDQVRPEASLTEDLGTDSIDTMVLVMSFEEEFGESIPDEDSLKMKTVGDIISYLESKGKD